MVSLPYSLGVRCHFEGGGPGTNSIGVYILIADRCGTKALESCFANKECIGMAIC